MSVRIVAARVVAVVVASTFLFGLARASSARVAVRAAAAARLRLSWSARPERIEVCRTLSAEELAQREEHMRQRVECDGRFATYALRVMADDHLLYEGIVQGAGLRHDRPMYLLRDLDVPLGMRRIRITFERREKTDGDAAAFAAPVSSNADTGLFAGRAQREAVEHARRARAAIPARLSFDTTLAFAPGRVILVTLDPERGTLRLVEGPGSPK